MKNSAKFALIGAIALIAAGLVFWHFSGSALTGVARQLLLQTAAKSLNGT